MNHTMKELPMSQRPYERCLRFGEDTLSDAELLAVILRSGSEGISAIDLAYEILRLCDPVKGMASLHTISVSELCKIRGIGKVKAVQLKCIAELSKRMAMLSAEEGQKLDNAELVAGYCMEQMRHMDHEEILLLCFNMKCRLLAQKTVSVGTVNQSCISPREIFQEAIRNQAAYVVLVHNHPSGDPYPSKEDDLLTERVSEAGRLIGIELMDHIIIGDRKYYSYREQH